MSNGDKEFSWQCDGTDEDGKPCQRFGFARYRTANGVLLKLCVLHVIEREAEIQQLRRALGEEGIEENRAA